MGFKRGLFKKNAKKTNKDIAIIGIACRFPDADNYTEFWENLQNAVNSIKEIPLDRWDIEPFFSSNRSEPNKSYSKWAGFMDRVDTFDALFFKTTPHEASRLDPQQRLILEEAWHCIEDAGVSLKELQKANTSVHIGLTRHDYIQYFFEPEFKSDGYAALAYTLGSIPNKISYFLNLTGESQVVDAACASSLVCIHNGIQLLHNGESQYALAGAVSVICHPWMHIACAKANMYSPEGQCKTFDAEANGYVPGEGSAILLLEKYEDAVKNGHHIYGVIKGSAVHHSGKTQSITAPKIEAQRGIIEEAIANAKVSPEQITYLEAHGTGTSLGDPIEVEALTQAFATSKKQYCNIGSVKSNIGHLESAAGMAGIIKVLMMLKHKKIAKTLNIKTPNPIIDFDNSPFKIAEKYQDWDLPEGIEKRIAGISSFGFGGVGAHLILEEYQAPQPLEEFGSKIPYPFILSTKSEKSMKELLEQWKQYLTSKDFSQQHWRNICETLMHGRAQLNYRFACTVQSKRELLQFISNLPVDKMHFSDQSIDIQNKTIVLRIKDTPKQQFFTFIEACKLYPPLQEAFDEFSAAILKLPGGKALLRNLANNKKSEYRLLRTFVSTYVPLLALLPTTFEPQYLMGKGLGELIESLESGLVDFEEIIQRLTSGFPSIHIHRPRIAIYDPSLGKSIAALKVPKEYCRKLFTGLTINTDNSSKIIAKAQALYQNQYTFKRLINEYAPIFEQCDISLEEALKGANDLDEKRRHIFTLLFALTIRHLISKWHLPEEMRLENTEAIELLNLLSEELLSPEDFVTLVLEASDEQYEKIADKIQKACQITSIRYEYPILKQMNQTVDEIPNPEDWLNQRLKEPSHCEENLPEDIKNPWYINIGGSEDKKEPGQPFLNIEDLANSLPGFLIDLWQNGIDIDWEHWYPKDENTKTCPLPVYPFLKERHWLDLKTDQAEEKQKRLPQKAQPEKQALADKYKIKGKTLLLPGSYLEWLQKAGSKYINSELNHFEDLRFTYADGQTDHLKTAFFHDKSKPGFKVLSEEQNGTVLCAGRFSHSNLSAEAQKIPLEEIKAACQNINTFDELRQKLKAAGLEQEETAAVSGQIRRNEREILAELHTEKHPQAEDSFINPALLNSALFVLFSLESSILGLPSMIRSLKIYRPLQDHCFVWINSSQDKTENRRHDYDIFILSPSGELLLAIEGVLYKSYASLQQGQITNMPQALETAENIQEKTENFLRELAAKITKIPKDKIHSKSSFANFGIDSIMVLRFNEELGKFLPKLRKTLLYEHKNLESLANYLIKNHRDDLANIHQEKPGIEADMLPARESVSIKETVSPAIIQTNKNVAREEPIAIIGLSGRFPKAENLAQFWENLKSGLNGISDLPSDRWPVGDYEEKISDKLEIQPGKIYCSRGGYIENPTCFDAEFFHISPKDAAYMDPQERLFLEAVYSCIEAAGYTPDNLLQSAIAEQPAARVGVFAGISFNLYPLLVSEGKTDEGLAPIVNTQTFSTANRVSYYFNFTGPSFTVDTACSSSLYAIHLACESIRRGECTLAVAGGSNLTLHPAKYATLSAKGFLASDGLCHAFSDGGDGYVPGEGVGAILLKPLSLALADKDHIYGVILGSAVSQDGKTMGYTVPNAQSQSEAIALALDMADINPRTISYVEAHGTGTALGDPVEIQGLQEVYERSTQDKAYCAIGSVKSNIGHLEAAAGVSQMVKVLLQMNNKTLVPSLIHGKGRNPNIDFEHSPFVVQQKCSAWNRPILKENGKEIIIPRRAAISSFGAGGSNVHLIMEAYSDTVERGKEPDAVIIPISAKSESQLYETANRLHEFLQNYADENPITGEAIRLDDLAYTLQVGREAFKIRLAFVARSVSELIDILGDFLSQGKRSDSADEPQLKALSEQWAQGKAVEWEKLWENYQPRRIYLPTYAFQKTACGTSTNYGSKLEQKTQDSEQSMLSNSFLEELADLPSNEQLREVIRWSQQQVGAILGYEPPKLPDPDVGFFEMGMESLQAIKLKVDAEKAFGITIPDSAIFDYPSIRAIAPFMLQLIPWEKIGNSPHRQSRIENKEQRDEDSDKEGMQGSASEQTLKQDNIDSMSEDDLVNTLESLITEQQPKENH